MEYTVNNTPSSIQVALKGQLTFSDNSKFKEIIDMLENEKLQSVSLNFREVDFIDSAGLGMLLLLRDQCQERNITVGIQSPVGQVHKIFMISKFDQLFTIDA